MPTPAFSAEIGGAVRRLVHCQQRALKWESNDHIRLGAHPATAAGPTGLIDSSQIALELRNRRAYSDFSVR